MEERDGFVEGLGVGGSISSRIATVKLESSHIDKSDGRQTKEQKYCIFMLSGISGEFRKWRWCCTEEFGRWTGRDMESNMYSALNSSLPRSFRAQCSLSRYKKAQ